MTIASEFDPVRGPSFEELHEFLARARAQEPVFFWPPMNVWVVTRYDDVVAVLRDNVHFSQRGILGHANDAPEACAVLASGVSIDDVAMLGSVDPPEHTRLRRGVSRALTPRRVEMLEPAVRRIVRTLADRFAAASRADLVAGLTYPLPVLVLFHLVGFDEAEMDRLKAWADDLTRLWTLPMPPVEQVACARSTVAFQRHVEKRMRERRRQPREDLMSDLVREADSGAVPVSDRELVLFFTVSLLLAGHETTSGALANALLHLLRDPARWRWIGDHPERLPDVVEECLRFDPPHVGGLRRVVRETTIAGVELPVGAVVYLLEASANHDERLCPHADALVLDRESPADHVTFGAGIHFCLGAPLARLEMRVALEELSRRFRNLRLAPGARLEYQPSAVFRLLRRLDVEWDANG